MATKMNDLWEFLSNYLVSIAIFLICDILLLSYLFFYSKNIYIFYVLSLVTSSVLLLQILFFKKREKKNLYLEMFLLFLTIRVAPLIYAGPNNIFGLDVYFELFATQNVNGWHLADAIKNTVTPYPMVHMWGAILNAITAIKLAEIAKWSGLYLSVLILIFYFLIGKFLFKSERIVLLAGLGFIFLAKWYASFGRFSFSLVIFYICVYFVIRHSYSDLNHYIFLLIILIILLPAMIFSHPLTRLVFLIFLISFLILYKIFSEKISYMLKKAGIFCNDLRNIKTIPPIIIIFGGLLLLLFVIYSPYSSQLIYGIKIIFHKTDYQPGLGFSVSNRYKIFNYGQMFFIVLFYLTLYRNRKLIKNFHLWLMVFFSIVLILINIPIYLTGIVNIWRITLFLWPMLLLPIAFIIWRSRKNNLLSFLIIGLILVNICGYPPFIYDHSLEPDYHYGEYKMVLPNSIKLPIKTFNMSGEIVGDHYVSIAHLYYKGRPVIVDNHFYVDKFRKTTSYSWFIFTQEDFKCIFCRECSERLRVTPKIHSEYQNTPQLFRLYNNGEVEIYKIKNTV